MNDEEKMCWCGHPRDCHNQFIESEYDSDLNLVDCDHCTCDIYHEKKLP